MFQVDPIIWLQTFESPFLTWLMGTITWLGYTPVYATILIVIFFSINLKKGFYIFLAMLIGGVIVDGMKRGLKFPRPSDLDSRIIEPGFERPPLLVENGGAPSFWSMPTSEAMEATKNQTNWSYGFPSGHVASATAFLLALAFFFKSRRILVFSIIWILLMALSRMYLGRHFIADVLAGMTVGGIGVLLAIFIVRPLQSNNKNVSVKSMSRWAILVIPLLILAPFIEILDKENIGRILALFLTYIVLLRIGFPPDKAVLWKRIARILLGIVLYFIVDSLLDPIMDSMEDNGNHIGLMGMVFLINFVLFMGTILLAKRIKLFESI
jgi:membrane-associated phospholipid phosphatase